MLSEKRYPKSTNFYRVCSVYASTQTTPEPWIAAWASKRQFMQQHLLYVDSNCLLLWIKGFLRSWCTTTHFSQTRAGTDSQVHSEWSGKFACTGMEQNGLLEEDYEHKEHLSKALHLCDAQDPNVGAGRGGSIPCPKHSIQNTGETLDENPPENPKQNTRVTLIQWLFWSASFGGHRFTGRVFHGWMPLGHLFHHGIIVIHVSSSSTPGKHTGVLFPES